MALPKRRFSHSRTRKKRTHKKLAQVKPSLCPHCKSAKLSHQICMVCGYYGDKQLIEIKQKKKKEKKQ